MKLYIKNMVSSRCKAFVQAELDKLGFHDSIVELGDVEITGNLEVTQREQLKAALLTADLELMDDKKDILVAKIGALIIDLVYYSEEPLMVKLSEFISQQMQHDYTYLAGIFSDIHSTTIEHFFILHKIARVKKLLLKHELSLTDIAYQMNYSSVAHLSSQFKKVTGITPSQFKEQIDTDSLPDDL